MGWNVLLYWNGGGDGEAAEEWGEEGIGETEKMTVGNRVRVGSGDFGHLHEELLCCGRGKY